MICTDASSLVALIDTTQRELHARCVAALSDIPVPMITTWPCFTEAMYLLYEYGGWPLQALLWDYVDQSILSFYVLTELDRQRMRTLMMQYRDMPMDLADASLVAAAESLNINRIFTLDSDFYVYRFRDRGNFEVLP
jgi:predicted nucleic acid-binding protein